MDSWAGFAKSLKLKMYLKDFDAHKSDIQALLSAGGLLEQDCGSWKSFYSFRKSNT